MALVKSKEQDRQVVWAAHLKRKGRFAGGEDLARPEAALPVLRIRDP